MAEKRKPKQAVTPANVDINVGGNVEKSVVIDGNNNVVNYYEAVSTNIEKHEPDFWALKHPYPMPPNFTGRVAERAMLTQWLNDDSENHLFILRALGGFGKSALSWQWLTHDVDSKEWSKVLWWSFYEGDASFDHFIEETLKYLKLEVPQGKREQVDELLNALQSQKVLIIMDGFERLLRAYGNMNASHQSDENNKQEDADRDCVDINTEHFLKGICSMPNMKGKALMTTRMTPRALEKFGQFIQGCREEELKAMHKDDAIAFFRAQGVQKGTNHEIEEACRLYGFHPLSLSLLSGYIMTDLKNSGDIMVAQKLKVGGNIRESQNQILEVSYNGLPPRQQKLLSTIACFRSSAKLDTLESIAENIDTLEEDLHDLMERGLLQFDKNNAIFDLHPIVRRYAYDRLTASDRTAAHTRLVNYFEAVPKIEKVNTLEDLAPVIELYHHMVRAGNLDEAVKLLSERLVPNPLHYQFGAYQLMFELITALFLDGEDKLPRLKDEAWQGWTLNALAGSYSVSGQPRRAVPLFEMTNDIYENKMKNKHYLAIGLGNVALDQIRTGALSAAERNLRRVIDLCVEIEMKTMEAVHRCFISQTLIYCGLWDDAEQELLKSQKVFDELGAGQTSFVLVVYHAQRFLLMARTNPQLSTLAPHASAGVVNLKLSIKYANRALELADETTRTLMNIPRDYIRAYWLLGAAYCANWVSTGSTTELTLAEENLSKALNLCRQINNVETEADILLDLARLRYAQGDFKDAQEKASEALVITERSGYVLQGADVNLFLAQYALEQEKDKAKAKKYTETALKLAYCDGPPYYYKVAYEEAERFLENLK